MKSSRKTASSATIAAAVLVVALIFAFCSCTTVQHTKSQYGTEGENTIALNLTKDPNVGDIFVTHVNGESTGAYIEYKGGILSGGWDYNYVNPLYVELNGKPIIFTIKCPVVVGRDPKTGSDIIGYRSTELRLSKLSDLKAGDVLTVKWMYQTQTFVFMDATGNIVQQTIPSFY